MRAHAGQLGSHSHDLRQLSSLCAAAAGRSNGQQRAHAEAALHTWASHHAAGTVLRLQA